MLSFFKQRKRSFGYAIEGIATLFKTQVHARIHLLAAIMVVALGCFFNVTPWEWMILVICISVVIAAEAFNSAIEFLTDLVSPEYHELAKKAKDTAAAAVLLLAIGAALVGALIFFSYFVAFFR